MKTLIISSTQPYAGKSGISLSVVAELAARGAAVGYFKPYGTMPVSEQGIMSDHDAVYISRYATAAAPLASISPLVETRGLLEDVLAGNRDGFGDSVRNAFVAASANAECMVVEGPSDLAEARSLGLNLCPLAEMLDARVLLVDRPRSIELPDSILWAADCLEDRLAGVVFNAVQEATSRFVTEDVVPYLRARGISVFGSIPHDPLLSSVSVEEIVAALGGTVLSAEESIGNMVESFMVGAMGQDKALRFFRRKARKAVITGGDRSDVQLAALETDTRCVILTGNLPPSSLVLSRAEELGVPMVLVPMDTLTAVEKMESLLGRVALHDATKAARMREMFARNVDVDQLMSSVYDR